MEASVLKIMGAVGGIGGITAGILLLLYRDFLNKLLLPQLGKVHAYRLLRLFLVLVWSVAVLGIAVWGTLEWQTKSPPPPPAKPIIVGGLPADCLPQTTLIEGSAFITVTATCPGLDEKQHRALIKRNINTALGTLAKLHTFQTGMFMPALSEFYKDPSEARWKAFTGEVWHVKQLMDKTTESILSLDPKIFDEAKIELAYVHWLVRQRTVLLFELPIEPPIRSNLEEWEEKYAASLYKFSMVLVDLREKLDSLAK